MKVFLIAGNSSFGLVRSGWGLISYLKFFDWGKQEREDVPFWINTVSFSYMLFFYVYILFFEI